MLTVNKFRICSSGFALAASWGGACLGPALDALSEISEADEAYRLRSVPSVTADGPRKGVELSRPQGFGVHFSALDLVNK